MTRLHVEAVWAETRDDLTLEALARASGMSVADLRDLVEYGALEPSNPGDAQWVFTRHCVVAVRAAGRLRRDFGLDNDALALAMSLLERIRALEDELRAVRARVPRDLP